jgi:hypothetical protein
MLNPDTWSIAEFPADQRPLLAVVVDTEEEFDWDKPLSSDNTGVGAMAHQEKAHQVFEDYGVRPTYVIDYAVASQADGYGPLRDLHRDGLCEIGAHLHPWVNPPFDEVVCNRNSYPGNLPPALEREKLVRLTRTIEDNLGVATTIYKAGRYGVGPATTGILEDLGFTIDASVVPSTDFRADEGPSFLHCGTRPYWFGAAGNLLEIPVTTSFAGLLAGGLLEGVGKPIYKAATTPSGCRLHLPGVLARLGIIERIRLTPEGGTPAEHRRLTRAMLKAGHKVFSLTYHSPSLAPGNTPYVGNDAELQVFLDSLRRYFDYFVGEVGGRPATLSEIRALAAP